MYYILGTMAWLLYGMSVTGLFDNLEPASPFEKLLIILFWPIYLPLVGLLYFFWPTHSGYKQWLRAN